MIFCPFVPFIFRLLSSLVPSLLLLIISRRNCTDVSKPFLFLSLSRNPKLYIGFHECARVASLVHFIHHTRRFLPPAFRNIAAINFSTTLGTIFCTRTSENSAHRSRIHVSKQKLGKSEYNCYKMLTVKFDWKLKFRSKFRRINIHQKLHELASKSRAIAKGKAIATIKKIVKWRFEYESK